MGIDEEKVLNDEATSETGHEEEQEGLGDVYSIMQWFIMMLSQSAWSWMGLQTNPISKKLEKDLVQAKAAIDTVAFMIEQVDQHISEEQRQAYKSMINDLRINFVNQSKSE